MTAPLSLDEGLERLHAALQRGDRPNLTDFLPANTPFLPALLELVHAELDQRWKQRDPVRVEDYLERYPVLREDAEGVVSLILAEIKFRRRYEPAISTQEYLDRFPAHATILRSRLSAELGTNGCFPQVPGFEILSELGRGGMGVVYKARQIALDRLVALKMVLDGGSLGSEEISRLRIEAEAVARLQHPNIVRLFEVGVHAGCSYLVLEYIDGIDLENCCRGTPQPPRQAAELVETLARASDYAHRQGIIHRDLKPANILIADCGLGIAASENTVNSETAADSAVREPRLREPLCVGSDNSISGRAVACGLPLTGSSPSAIKILDFGLARRLLGDAHLTLTGQVLGTPGYMAPEQAGSDPTQIGPAADIYALGAILYSLLCGRPPFHGVSPLETLRQQAQEEPRPPRQLQPGIPRDLEVICLKCLAREPARRYGSAGELADDLRRFLAGEPITARPVVLPERIWKWVRRRPAVAGTWFAGLLVLVAGLSGLVWYNAQLQAALEQAEHQRQQSKKNEAAAHAASELAQRNRYNADMRLGLRQLRDGDVLNLADLLRRHQPTPTDPTDRRGFEWWYLARHARQHWPPFRAHKEPLFLLTCTPDGRHLLTAAKWGEVKLWDCATAREAAHLSSGFFGDGPRNAAVAPGGQVVAIRPDRNGVEICTPHGQRLVRREWREGILGLTFLDDAHLAVADAWGVVSVWHWQSQPDRVQRLNRVPIPVEGLMVGLPWARQLARSAGHGLEVHDWASEQLSWRVRCEHGLTALALLPGRKWLAAAQGPGPLLILNEHGGPVAQLRRQQGVIRALAVSPDERVLAAAEDDAVRFWDTATWRSLGSLRWQAQEITALAFSPDGRKLAAATRDGVVHQLATGVPVTPETLISHTMTTGPVAFAPDGKLLAVTGASGEILLLELATQRVHKRLAGDGGAVQALLFTANGQSLAVVSAVSPTIQCWDVDRGQCRYTLRGPAEKPFRAASLSPDGLLLATVDHSSELRLWDVATGQQRHSWQVEAPVVTAAFAPDQCVLAAALTGGRLQLWDLSGIQATETGKAVPALLTSWSETVPPVQLVWFPDGRRLALRTDSGQFSRAVSDPGRTRLELMGTPKTPLGWLQLASKARALLTGNPGEVELWQVRAGALEEKLGEFLPGGPLGGVALSPDGRWLACTHHDGSLRLWEVATWRVRYPCGVPLGPVQSLAVTADSATLHVGHRVSGPGVRHFQRLTLPGLEREVRYGGKAPGTTTDGLQQFGLQDRQPLPALPARETLAPPDRVAVSPNGQLLAAGSRDDSIWVWDRKANRIVQRLFLSQRARIYATGHELAQHLVTGNPEYREGIIDLAFSPDGSQLVAMDQDGRVMLWSCGPTPNWQGRLLAGPDPERHWLRFAPNGKTFALGAAGAVELWDLPSGTRIATLGTQQDAASLCGAFTPDGTHLVSGTADRKLQVWNMANRQRVTDMVGHLDRVTGLAFTPNGRTLASCGWDGTVRLWNVATWEEVGTLEGHRGRVNAVTFTPDGSTLISGGETADGSGEVLLWRAAQKAS